MAVKLFSCVFGNHFIPQRCILVIMLTFAICYQFVYRVQLSIAMTEMVVPINKTTGENESVVIEGTQCPADEEEHGGSKGPRSFGPRYNWNGQQQGDILGMLPLGYLITQVPFGLMTDKYGARHILLLSTLGCAVLNFLTPLACMIGDGYYAVAGLRLLIGMCQGALFPVLSVMMTTWIPLSERGSMGGIVYAGQHLGCIVGNTVTGIWMSMTSSWAFTFYAWGILGIAWYLVALFTVFSKPSTHPFITDAEAQYLQDNIVPAGKKPPVPWCAMIKSPVTFSILAAQSGHDFLIFMLVTDLPLYMKEVLRFNVEFNGYFTGFVFFTLFLSSLVCGYIADFILRKNIVSLLNLRRLQMIISTLCCAGFLLFAGYAKCRKYLAVSFLAFGSFIMGPYYSGTKLGPVDVSVNFSGTLTAIISACGGLSGYATTQTVAKIALHHTVEEWQRIYWITFLVTGVTTVMYVTYFKPERVEWDYVEDGK